MASAVVLIFLLLLTGCCCAGRLPSATPGPLRRYVINTPLGRIIGRESPVNPDVIVFRSIPFTHAPVGALRFAEPVPLTKLPQDPYDAREFGPACPQTPSIILPNIAENCTWVAVWVPKSVLAAGVGAKRPLLPTLVWIHGGGFVSGSAQLPLYNGANLAAAQNVVVVSVQYRLGMLGFSSLAALPLGFLDQQEGLRWVSRYVSAFGGDPHRVTIIGESAGAISVWLHLVSPTSRGLFHGAIAESGAATPTETRAEAANATQAAVAALGCTGAPDVLECMRALPAALIINSTSSQLGSWEPFVAPPALPAQPVALLEAGEFAHVPVIGGFNRNESNVLLAALFLGFEIFEASTPDMSLQAVSEFLRTYLHFNATATAAAISLYRRVGGLATNMTLLARIYSDALFSYATLNSFDLLALHGNPGYLYYFDHMVSFVPALFDPALVGVTHTTELPFVFSNPCWVSCKIWPGTFTPEEAQLAKTVGTLWGNFVKTGVPSPAWPRYDPARRASNQNRVLKIDLSTSQKPSFIEGMDERFHFSFWKTMPGVVTKS